MPKNINYLIIAMFPYYILLVFFCLLRGYFVDQGLWLLASIGVLYCIALICAVTVFMASFNSKNDGKALLYVNMIIKLIHIPAFMMLFLLGLISTITIFTIGLSVIIFTLDVLIIILSGFVGTGAILKCLKEKRFTKKEAIRYIMSQFIFCLDVFSAITIYRNEQKEALP